MEVISGFFWLITYRNMSNFLDVQKLMQQRFPLFSLISLNSYIQFISNNHLKIFLRT